MPVFVSNSFQRLSFLRWFHWLVIIASLAMTIFIWQLTATQANQKAQMRFEKEAARITDQLQERLHHYENALHSGEAFMATYEGDTPHIVWKRFAEILKTTGKSPGLNGIGIILHVPKERLETYITTQRKTRKDFKIHPVRTDAQEYFPITYIEPEAENLAAVGLDMAHEQHRLEATLRARDTGKPQITAPIILVQDEAKTPGFLFFVPYYQDAQQPETIAQRKKAFIGMVYAPFIVSKLIEGTLQESKRMAHITVKDSDVTLYDEHNHNHSHYDPSPVFSSNVSLEVYGRTWDVAIHANAQFRHIIRDKKPDYILIAGLLIEALIIALLLGYASASQRYKRLADIRDAELHKVEDNLEAYIDASASGYWDWRIQDDYQYMSPRFWDMLGHDPREKRHHPEEWQKVISEEDLRLTLENLSAHILSKGTSAFKQEACYYHKDGSTVVILTSGKIIEWDKSGKPLRMIGTHTDVTSLKKAEKQLQHIFDNVPVRIWYKDDKNKIIRLNKQAALSMGGTVEEFEGKNTYDLFPEMAKKYHDDDLQVLNSGCAKTGIIERYTPAGGSEGWVNTDKVPYFDPKTGERFLFVVSSDITKLKETEEQLVAYSDELARSNQELDDFAYIASHDLKEPLRGLQNHATMLRRTHQDVLNEEGIRKLDRISFLTKRMESLINDLLHYSRIGRVSLARKKTDLNMLVSDVRDMILAAQDDVEINIVDSLPTITCDAHKISELIRNLITNGVKYNENEKKLIEIGIDTTYTCDDNVALYVKDNGIGIEDKFHDDIFKIFKRLHKKEAYGGGTGSGLTIVKRIVERHDGTIWVTSKLNEGTCFHFTLKEQETHDDENK